MALESRAKRSGGNASEAKWPPSTPSTEGFTSPITWIS